MAVGLRRLGASLVATQVKMYRAMCAGVVMTVDQILVREFHLKFPTAKSIEADDKSMTVKIDGRTWVMEVDDDELLFRSDSEQIYFALPDDWPARA